MLHRSYLSLIGALAVLIACSVWVPLVEDRMQYGAAWEPTGVETQFFGPTETHWGPITRIWSPRPSVLVSGDPTARIQVWSWALSYRLRWEWFGMQMAGVVVLLLLLGGVSAAVRRRRWRRAAG